MKYVVIDADDRNSEPVAEITEDVVVMLQKANELSVGRQVLVYLFEWFLGVIEDVYRDQGVTPGERVTLDLDFFKILSNATKFGLRAYMLYEEVFNLEGGDVEEEIDIVP